MRHVALRAHRPDGSLVVLAEQDRTRWDTELDSALPRYSAVAAMLATPRRLIRPRSASADGRDGNGDYRTASISDVNSDWPD